MKNVIYLFGPTLMIFIGISYFESILITFLLFYSWLFFIPFITYWKKQPLRFSFFESIIKDLTLQPIMMGLVSGIVCGIVIFTTLVIFDGHLFSSNQISSILLDWGFSGPSVWVYLFVLIVINPFLEEWYWREFMYKRYLDNVGTRNSVIITSFFYALYHLLVLIPLVEMPFSLLATIPVFIAGLLWGYFRVIFSSIVATVISHTFADIGIVLFYILFLMR